MLYIIVALKSEAQAFVERYKLKKSHLKTYTLYEDSERKVIVSGVGVGFSRDTTQTFIDYFDLSDDVIFLNVGICAAEEKYQIGDLLKIGSVTYGDTLYSFAEGENIFSLDEATYESLYEIVDMEAFGFYDAVSHSPAIKNFHILKVVSDHFTPQTVTKEQTKTLIFNQIDAINKIIFPKG